MQMYRLAALVHDIGHYPFSHAMEDALKNYHSARVLEQEEVAAPLFHEEVSEEVLTHDATLKKLVNAQELAAIFRRKEPPRFTNTVSSDLDADRIDFLLRTAHHTGLPYGSVDLDYIISQIRVDPNSHLCLTHKAVRAADHFLLCRFFDYQQVAYHKTVAGFELVLKDVLRELMLRDDIDCEPDEVRLLISTNEWLSFDDADVISDMRYLHEEVAADANSALRLKLASILERRPPKLICELEYMADRSEDQSAAFALQDKQLQKGIKGAAAKAGIDESLFYVWRTPSKGLGITKVPPTVTIQAAAEGDVEEEAFHQTVRILDRAKMKSVPIFDLHHSLMKVLAHKALFALRLYALIPEGKPDAAKEIEGYVRSEVDLPWK
jgi:HD superfamily phosphohydrolase